MVLTADGNHLDVLVQDNGCGFGTAKLEGPIREGFGLHSIKERLESLGGSMTIPRERGCGRSIHLIAPLKQEAETDQSKALTCAVFISCQSSAAS